MLENKKMNDRKGKVGMMYTGGKDSTYSLGRLLELGYKIVCLITIVSANEESYMLHTRGIEMTRLSSSALNLPLFMGYTNGRKEEELRDIKNAIVDAREKYEFEAIGTGAIASQYQKSRMEAVASDCGLSALSPIWGVDQRRYVRSLIQDKYRFILTSVSCEGLNRDWLGREITLEGLQKLEQLSLKHRFNIAFEGGEAETFVLDCPLYKQSRIRILDAEIAWNGYYGFLNIKRAILEDKDSADKLA
jgi:diphthine-ammonia ligase